MNTSYKIKVYLYSTQNKHLTYLLFLGLVLFSFITKAQKPNILLIVSDDLNTRIGPYMNIDKHTPHLDRLAN